MIDLYGMASPNVTKITIMLEECGLPYRFRWVDIFREEQFTPEFLKLNPNAKVPVIVDQNGPGEMPYTVFESGAILLYLAEKAGRFLPADTRARHDTLQWLMIQLTGFGPVCGQYVHFSRWAPQPGNEYGIERYRNEVMRLYRLLNRRLEQVPYLGGTEYSIADISMYPWAALHEYQELDWSGLDRLQRWFDIVTVRPAVTRSMEKTQAIMQRDAEQVRTASQHNLERFIHRDLPEHV